MAAANFSFFAKLGLFLLFLYLFGGPLFYGQHRQDASEYLAMLRQIIDEKGTAATEPLRMVADGMKESVDQTVNTALLELFKELDQNGDGVIEFSEFQGMTLRTWAMYRSLDITLKSSLTMPSLSTMRSTVHEALEAAYSKLPQFRAEVQVLFPETSWGDWLVWYTLFLCFVQWVLFCSEYILAWLGMQPFTPPENPEKLVDKVERVPKEVALSYDTPLEGWYEVTKTTVMTLSGLAVLRLIQCFIFFLVGMICINLAAVAPYRFWHFSWLRGASFCISGLLFSLGYYRVHFTGQLAPREKCKILVANHMALFEVVVLYGQCFPSFVSRVENLAVPLFAGVVRASDAILVDRNDPQSRKKTLMEIRRRARDPNAPQLMLFPEGTLNNQRALFNYKIGAFEALQPVQPVCIKIPYKHFNPVWTGQATGGNDIGEVVWRTLCQFVNRMEVQYLPVLEPLPEEMEDCKLYAERCRLLTAAALRIGVADCSYQDYVELQSAFAKEQNRVQARQQGGWRSKLRPAKTETKGENRSAGGGWWFPFIAKGWATRNKIRNVVVPGLSSDDDCMADADGVSIEKKEE